MGNICGAGVESDRVFCTVGFAQTKMFLLSRIITVTEMNRRVRMTELMPLPAKVCGYAPNADIMLTPADSVQIAAGRRTSRKDMADA